jgi:hypothetical protein
MEGRMRQKRRHTGDRGTLRRTSTENPCHLVSAEIRAQEFTLIGPNNSLLGF